MGVATFAGWSTLRSSVSAMDGVPVLAEARTVRPGVHARRDIPGSSSSAIQLMFRPGSSGLGAIAPAGPRPVHDCGIRWQPITPGVAPQGAVKV